MELQIKILESLEAIRNDYLTVFFTVITMMAEELYLTLFLAIIYWCIDKVKALKIAYLVLFNGVMNSFIKSVIRMPRPFEMGIVSPQRVSTATGYSFPSNHTQTAVSFWMGMMLTIKTKATVIVGTVFIILTAVSRLYLGVHWPMDVAGGILFGIIFTYFANEMLDEESRIKDILVIGVSIVMLVVLLFNMNTTICKAVAGLWGLCLGAYLEQKYVRFKTKGSLNNQVTKIGIGILGVAILFIGGNQWLPAIKVVTTVQYALISLWIVAGAPWVFTRIKK